MIEQQSRPSASDGELVLRAQQGDRSALSSLIDRHIGSVRACVLAVLGPRSDVDDLVQESLVRGVAGLAKLREPDRFGAWLRGIARHLCVDRIRRKPPPTAPLDGVPEPAAPPEETPEDHSELWRAIGTLPEALREALYLFYVAGLGYAEIGARLGITTAAVNQRLTRARARLRDHYATHRSSGATPLAPLTEGEEENR